MLHIRSTTRGQPMTSQDLLRKRAQPPAANKGREEEEEVAVRYTNAFAISYPELGPI